MGLSNELSMTVNNDDVERVREMAYTQQLTAYKNQQEKVVQIKFYYNVEKALMVQSRIKMLRGLKRVQRPLKG